MTDRERFLALLDDFGIYYATSDDDRDADGLKVEGPEVVIPWRGFKDPNRNDGYAGFYASFMFDDAGAFQSVWIGE